MKTLVIICLFAYAQAIPADPHKVQRQSQFEAALAKSQLTPIYEETAKNAEGYADSFMNQYNTASSKIQNTLSQFPKQVFNDTFRRINDKIQLYVKSLKPALQDTKTSAEDKAHFVVESLAPLVEGLITEFDSAAGEIETYLSQPNFNLTNEVLGMSKSVQGAVGNTLDGISKYTAELSPEMPNLVDAYASDVAAEQAAYEQAQANARKQSADISPQMAEDLDGFYVLEK